MRRDETYMRTDEMRGRMGAREEGEDKATRDADKREDEAFVSVCLSRPLLVFHPFSSIYNEDGG